MEKTTCLMCGCLSEQIFCTSCSEEGWNKYRQIQSFLSDYPGITTIEVCRELSVSLNFIKGLVSAGYLNLNLPKPQNPEPRPSGFRSGKNRR